MFTRTIAIEEKRYGIRANALTPSLVLAPPRPNASRPTGSAASSSPERPSSSARRADGRRHRRAGGVLVQPSGGAIDGAGNQRQRRHLRGITGPAQEARSSAGTRPVGGALLQECVAALDGLIGHVRQPGRLPGEQLLADQPVVEQVERILQHPLRLRRFRVDLGRPLQRPPSPARRGRRPR